MLRVEEESGPTLLSTHTMNIFAAIRAVTYAARKVRIKKEEVRRLVRVHVRVHRERHARSEV